MSQENKPMNPKMPSNVEELKRLKLAKKELKKKQNAKPQVQSVVPEVLERVFETVSDQNKLSTIEGNVRVMTFNLLAQSLIKRELFPDSGEILKWKLRRKMIVDEIKLYHPDIISIQELDNFDSYYKGVLASIGYAVEYYYHPVKRHGCGIAYKIEKFDIIDYSTVDYNTDDTCPPSFMTGNVAQLIALQLKGNPKVGFVVGNTHLYWKPCANYERFRQITIYKKRFMEFKSRLTLKHNHRWISLLLGDFNSEPIDAGYSILTKNQLDQAELDDLNESRLYKNKDDNAQMGAEDDEEGESVSITGELATLDQLLEIHRGTPSWTSVYSNFGKISNDRSQLGSFGEPKFTNYTSQFQGTLDYMFLEKDDDSIAIRRILMLPKEEFLRPSLPNKNFGSDHMCLVADIDF
ncbi:Endonuclease/exonuclease/phosphatase [Mucor mucedo]|uniref:Endonuclease/exonuclease/phosphatase n=1 Tax=Mucor mucedo TaxID=29922 RepID=UPI00221EE905|nr:Endonuclease/exonuclease/phosphatase [Mucor mucedo]KAI7896250.1 Endonuclease/exonuclease/phosphatase [Mucor mucedo]